MLFILSLIIGCGGISEEAYTEQSISLSCERAIECYDEKTLKMMGWTDQATCEESLTALVDAGEDVECEFDSKAASACLDEYAALSCDDIMAGTMGASCDDVCPVAAE
jgi:hypothetical protein